MSVLCVFPARPVEPLAEGEATGATPDAQGAEAADAVPQAARETAAVKAIIAIHIFFIINISSYRCSLLKGFLVFYLVYEDTR